MRYNIRLLFLLALFSAGKGLSLNASQIVCDSIKPEKIKIVWWQDAVAGHPEIHEGLTIDTAYLSSAPENIKAIIAYYSARAGTECWWANDKANENFSNLDCRHTKALGLGYQGSEAHMSLIKKWFKNEPDLIKDVENFYNVPFTATVQNSIDNLTILINGNIVTVECVISGMNIREDTSWELKGLDVFEMNRDFIKVVSRTKE
jgi:hypothetical protein